MDVETSEAITQLGERIDALERSLRKDFREGLAENRRHADVQFEAVRDDIRIVAEGFATVSSDLAQHRVHTERLVEGVRAEIRGETAAFRLELAEVRSEFRTGMADQRRHSDSFLEGIRDEIRALATNVASLSAKVDSRPS